MKGQAKGNSKSHSSGGATFDNDGLPATLPSYLPGNQHTGNHLLHGQSPDFPNSPDGMIVPDSPIKRQAPIGQWKTPPQFLYSQSPFKHTTSPDSDVRATDLNACLGGMSVSNNMLMNSMGVTGIVPGSDLNSENKSDGDANARGKREPSVILGPNGVEFDPALLARMSGKDPSEIGMDHVKSMIGCPDLLAIYQRLQEEDERRRRRLARNRASARLRRQKKKGLVDTYEQEVSQLESCLSKLNHHKWGKGQEQDLREALACHSRYKHIVGREKRKMIECNLDMYHKHLSVVKAQHMEHSMLAHVSCTSNISEKTRELVNEIKAELGITDEQARYLSTPEDLLRPETREIAIVDKCLAALRTHEWLHFPEVDNITDTFHSLLMAPQVQKYTQWVESNWRNISQLHFNPGVTPKPGTIDENELQFFFGDETLS